MKLDSAVFYSSDLSKAVEFYRDFIGLEVNYVQEGAFASFMFENGLKLGIKQQVEEREIPGSQTFFVLSEDAESDYKKYKEKGAEFKKELVDQPWGKSFSIFDPDKNKIEFIEYPQE